MLMNVCLYEVHADIVDATCPSKLFLHYYLANAFSLSIRTLKRAR